MARNTKLNDETHARLKQAIGLGATYELACAYAGINQSTFYRWLSTNEEFRKSIKASEGAGAVELLGRIKKEAKEGSWQAAAWLLERRYPEMYGRNRLELTGANGGAIEINHHTATPEEKRQRALTILQSARLVDVIDASDTDSTDE
jgi:hypothetical protein